MSLGPLFYVSFVHFGSCPIFWAGVGCILVPQSSWFFVLKVLTGQWRLKTPTENEEIVTWLLRRIHCRHAFCFTLFLRPYKLGASSIKKKPKGAPAVQTFPWPWFWLCLPWTLGKQLEKYVCHVTDSPQGAKAPPPFLSYRFSPRSSHPACQSPHRRLSRNGNGIGDWQTR